MNLKCSECGGVLTRSEWQGRKYRCPLCDRRTKFTKTRQYPSTDAWYARQDYSWRDPKIYRMAMQAKSDYAWKRAKMKRVM